MKKLTILICIFSIILSLSACKKEEQPKEYTYNTYRFENLKPWISCFINEDHTLTQYTEMGLYDLVLTQDMNQYELVPEMASNMPEDVTINYQGQYEIPQDATHSYAYQIKLNPDAKWEDGSPINATTYLSSMYELLSFTNYNDYKNKEFPLIISRVTDYLRQGEDTFLSLQEYVLKTNEQPKELFVSESACFGIGDETYYPITDDTTHLLISESYGYGATPKELYETFLSEGSIYTHVYASYHFPKMDVSEIGLLKTGEYEITIICGREIDEFDFKYLLRYNWLVHPELYETCKMKENDEIVSTYGTSKETYLSYGPYKISSNQDNTLILEKNEMWYGYHHQTNGIEFHKNQFQTTRICINILDSASIHLAFLQGDIDLIPVDEEEIRNNPQEEHLLVYPTDYIDKISLNSDYNKLKERQERLSSSINKTILANVKFREAISWAIDRKQYANETTPKYIPTITLLNSLYMTDLKTSEIYRNTQEGKKVLEDVYQESNPSGYDIDQARKLFQEAYEEEIHSNVLGHYEEEQKIELEVLPPQIEESEKQVAWIQNALTEATKNTSLEGKIELKIIETSDRYQCAFLGEFEIFFSTLGGMTNDPWKFLQVYAHPYLTYEYGLDTTKEGFTVFIDDEEVTLSFYDWYIELTSGKYTIDKVEHSVRLTILSAFETAYLKTFTSIPLTTRSKGILLSNKIKIETPYLPLIEFGGIRYLSYQYTDEEWEK